MMKIKSILLIILAMIANSAQAIVVIEDFADKDLKNNPGFSAHSLTPQNTENLRQQGSAPPGWVLGLSASC